MIQLYFCRHGESEMNRAGLFAGTTDTPLTDIGREQARLEGEKAKGHGIDLIVSSPMSRALETAQIIAKEIGYPADKIMTNKLFVERDFGKLEGKPYDSNLVASEHPTVETDESVIERARRAAEWIESLDARVVLVVSHGSLGRALRYVYQPHADFTERIPNATIVRFV